MREQVFPPKYNLKQKKCNFPTVPDAHSILPVKNAPGIDKKSPTYSSDIRIIDKKSPTYSSDIRIKVLLSCLFHQVMMLFMDIGNYESLILKSSTLSANQLRTILRSKNKMGISICRLLRK